MSATMKKQVFTWVATVLGMTLIALVVALFIPSLLPAAPAINWSPSSLNEEIALGQSKTLVVTFTTTDTIKAATIRVVPALQPFVQVTPSQFNNISKGQKVTVKITFSASKTAPFGMFDGTVQLRDKGTIAKPLPVKVLVTVVPVPPDPGEAGKQTIGGIDSDGDGVRDDIQRYIVLHYPTSAKTRKALSEYTISFQSSLLGAAGNNKDQVSNAHNRNTRDLECVYYVRRPDAAAITNALIAEILNTEERSRAYIQVNKILGGSTWSIQKPTDWKASCNNFDPDTLGD